MEAPILRTFLFRVKATVSTFVEEKSRGSNVFDAWKRLEYNENALSFGLRNGGVSYTEVTHVS